MIQAIGHYLRQLRRKRGLTLEQAARAAGIGRVTLNRWENGVYQPRLPELEALLTALNADAKEKQEALARMDAPRAREQVYQTVARIAEQSGIGPRPHSGDALRALRQRRRMTLEEAAERVGVTARTLRRWERVEIWPSVEQLHRLCFAVGAYEEEVIALTCGAFSRPFGEEEASLSLETLRQQLNYIIAQVTKGEPAMIDMLFLALEARIWSLATRSVQAQRLLAETYTHHAAYLEFRGQLEHTQMAERALDLVPEKAAIEPEFMKAAVLSAPLEQDPARAFSVLRQWLPMARVPWLRAWMISLMALSLGSRGALEEALALATEACEVATRTERSGEIERRQYVKADLLLKMGRAGEAAALITNLQADTPYFDGYATLLRGEALLAVGEPQEAQRCLQHAARLITTHDLSNLKDRTVSLAQQLMPGAPMESGDGKTGLGGGE